MSKSEHTSINAIRPWDKPTKQEGEAYNHVCDTQEVIEVCLNCLIPDGCHPKRRECSLTGGVGKAMKEFAERKKLDAAVLRAVKAGWSDRRIRDTLHIGQYKLDGVKERLNGKGEIP